MLSWPHAGDCDFPATPTKASFEAAIYWREDCFPRLLNLTWGAAPPPQPDRHVDLNRIVRPESVIGDRAFAILPGGKVFFAGWQSTTTALPSVQIAIDARLPVQITELGRLHAALAHLSGGPALLLTSQQRHRLKLALRATDATLAGCSYREIALGLFGDRRVDEGAWKTHDLRSKTIRLVKFGLELTAGGYRRLLDPSRPSSA